MHDVVDALAFAHARGVIHRDIKPANILTQGSHALVTDFGVAKALSAALPFTGMTSAGIAIGTPAYMAPEQLAGDATADHRMDIYAVGLLAYELMTGVSPFTGPSPRETLAAQLTRDPKPLYEVSPEIPRTLSNLVMRCLAKDPSARPQRADEVLDELDALTMPLPITSTVATTEAKAAPPAPRRRPWMGVAAVAILFAVLAGVGYAVTRPRPQSPPSATVPRPAAPPVTPQARPESLVSKAMAATTAAIAASKPSPTPQPRPVITHADSVRIAEVVRKRLEAAKLRDSIAKAKLAAQTERRMMDSIIAANSGAAGGSTAMPPTGPRRVAIAEPSDTRQWPESGLLGRAVADSLRRLLRTRPRQYALVDEDSVRTIVARTRDLTEISKAMNSDLLISVRLQALPRDSAMLLLQAWDLTAVNAFRSRTAAGRPGPRSEVLANLDAVLLSLLTHLDEMTRAPRR
jgi:serine/threonine-protein kinase